MVRYFSASGCATSINYGGFVSTFNYVSTNTVPTAVASAACAAQDPATTNNLIALTGLRSAANQFTTTTVTAAASTNPFTTVVAASVGQVFFADYTKSPAVRHFASKPPPVTHRV